MINQQMQSTGPRYSNVLCTFGHQCVLPCASQSAVDLTDQLHVIKKGVKSIKIGETDHVGGAASCSLGEQKQKNASEKQYILDFW